MIYLTEFILVLPVNLVIAWWHSRLIKAGRPIRHGWWAASYTILIILAICLLQDLHSLQEGGLFSLACGCGRLVVFNIALNLFRGLSWTYISKISTSIIDKVEIRLFGSRVWIAEVITGIIFIILQFFL